MNANHEHVICEFDENMAWNFIMFGKTMFNNKSGALEDLSVEFVEGEEWIGWGGALDNNQIGLRDCCSYDNVCLHENGIFGKQGCEVVPVRGSEEVLNIS